ncbi:MAG: hypothetical protein KF812_12005 [Fimbriimonadaceae bacterium]|nr:hypothetical protein [Fimbriimonadaceae bacterium]
MPVRLISASLACVGLAGSLVAQDSSRFAPSFYVQFQYRDSNEVTSSAFRGQHGFHFRRLRLGGTYSFSESTSAKVVFDGVSGSNQDEFKLKEAFVLHRFMNGEEPTGFSAQAGQFPLPLGYELSRSSSQREMPEYSVYNRLLFPGEQIRGVMGSFDVSTDATARVGVFNAMANDDVEQKGQSPSPGGRLAVFAGLDWKGESAGAGVSGFFGERPAFVGTAATSPQSDRQLVALHGYWNPTSQLSFRGELLTGRDRVPTAAGNPALFDQPLLGWHGLVTFKAGDAGTFFSRVGGFDPNTNVNGNSIREYGVGYRANIAKGATATLAFERIHDPSRPRSFSITTFRIQYVF